MSGLISITDAEFEAEVLQATKPVLAYFWANWCGPCRLVSPSIQAIAEIYSDRLKVVKMEVDSAPLTVKQYHVEGVPALLIFKGGNQQQYHEGAITKPKIISMIDAHL
jgi:thioredoxin 1